jgi:hypothetical protein
MTDTIFRLRRFGVVPATLGLLAIGAMVSVDHVQASSAADGDTRTYYIAADPVDWDYAPSGKGLLGRAFDANAPTYLDGGADRIGHVYRKSIVWSMLSRDFSLISKILERYRLSRTDFGLAVFLAGFY